MSRLGAGVLAAALLLAGAPAAAQQDAVQVLLRSAWLWEVKERPDLARAALEKLQNVSPDDAQGLYELGLLDIKMGQLEAAGKVLYQLKTTHPDSPYSRKLAEAHRIATKDHFELANIRRMKSSGKLGEAEKAVAALKKLFPDGPPGGDLGVEYYQILARDDAQIGTARKGLRRLVKENPGDPRYPLGLAALLVRDAATRAEGFRLYADTARQYDLHQPGPLTPWREALRTVPTEKKNEHLFRDYLAAVPDDPEVLAMLDRTLDPTLAGLRKGLDQLNRSNLTAADAAITQSYRERPDDPEVLRGLALLRARQGRMKESQDLYARAREREPSPRTRVASLLDQANGEMTANQLASARSHLEVALQLTPDNPWARLDLAELYRRMGLTSKARALMAQAPGLKSKPADPEMVFANAIFLSHVGETQGALDQVARVAPKDRSRGMNNFAAHLRAELRRRRLLAAAANHDEAEVQRQLAEAEKKAGENPAERARVADLWIDLGQPDKGVALLKEPVEAQATPSAALLLAYAGVLNRVRRDGELAGVLNTLDQRRDQGHLDTTQRADLDDLRKSWVLRESERLAQAGDSQGALARIDGELQRQPGDQELKLARAELLTDTGQFDAARAMYGQLRAEKPKDLDTQLSWARYLRKSGHKEEALAEYDRVLAAAPHNDIDTREAVARGYLALDETDKARAVMDNLRAAYPDDPSVLVHSGRVEAADSNYDGAVAYYERAQAVERKQNGGAAPGSPTAADDELARLARRRREGWVWAGLDYSYKPGDPGVSRFADAEVPIEVRYAIGYESSAFVRLDWVRLDAGTLPADYNIAGLFGQVQAFGPGSLAAFPNGVPERQQGIFPGIGFDNRHWHADIGTSPTSFPVHHLVGGVRYDTGVDPWRGSIELSRRAVTSSLLSYAGAFDPVTGQPWGGVHNTAITLRGSYDQGRLYHYASLSYGLLDGENVLKNAGGRLRGGSDWTFYREVNARVSVGWVLALWHYDHQERYSTFGHGGYYSPQKYVNFSIPLEWTGRVSRLSYRLRGSGSVAYSSESTIAFYPTRPDLQALAGTQPLPANQGFTGPFYDGGSGTGYGWSVGGSLEYKVTQHLFIGALASIDRSEFYKPTFFGLWFKVPFLPWTDPIWYPPRPPTPYSQF